MNHPVPRRSPVDPLKNLSRYLGITGKISLFWQARSIARSLARSLDRWLVVSGVRISNYRFALELFGGSNFELLAHTIFILRVSELRIDFRQNSDGMFFPKQLGQLGFLIIFLKHRQVRCQIQNRLPETLDPHTLDPQTLDPQTLMSTLPDPKSIARDSRPPDFRPPDFR